MKLYTSIADTAGELSHPARGAWIEMPDTVSYATAPRVAPRKGCVD